MISNKQQPTYLIIPLTVPGFKKERLEGYFRAYCKQVNWEFDMVSSKEINKKFEEKAQARQIISKDMSTSEKDEARFELRKQSLPPFYILIHRKLTKLHDSESLMPRILLVNKNHAPNSWSRLFNFIRDCEEKDGMLIETVGLTTSCKQELKAGKFSYPMDLVSLLNCLHTTITDKNEDTMEGDEASRVLITMKFLNMYSNLYKRRTLDQFSSIFKIDVFNEEKGTEHLQTSPVSKAEFITAFKNLMSEVIRDFEAQLGGGNAKFGAGTDTKRMKDNANEMIKLLSKAHWECFLKSDEEVVKSISSFFWKIL